MFSGVLSASDNPLSLKVGAALLRATEVTTCWEGGKEKPNNIAT